MVPYTYYRLCESYREADGKVRQRTVLGLGELLDFPEESRKRELAEQLTSMINFDVRDNDARYPGQLLFTPISMLFLRICFVIVEY